MRNKNVTASYQTDLSEIIVRPWVGQSLALNSTPTWETWAAIESFSM